MTDSISLNIFKLLKEKNQKPTAKKLSLEELAAFLAPAEPPCVTREERELNELFSMNIYKEGTTRETESVAFMTGIVFDFDNKANRVVPITTVTNQLDSKRIAYSWYTTHSNTAEQLRWRLVIPFAKPLPVKEWSLTYEAYKILIGNPWGIDEGASKDVARIWYPPYKNKEGHPYRCGNRLLDLQLIDPVDIESYLTRPEDKADFKKIQEQQKKGASSVSGEVLPSSSLPKSNFDPAQALRALTYLDPSCSYEEWLKVGMALHHQFNGHKIAFNMWNIWSSLSPKYKDVNDLVAPWRCFTDKEKSVSIGTLIHMAKQNGYEISHKLSASTDLVVGLDVMDFIKLLFPVPKMIIDPIIPEQGIAMMYAQRGTGKTYLSISVACIAACGQTMFENRWKASQENKVVFIDGEMPANRLQDRLKGILHSLDCKLSQKDLLTIITPDLQERCVPDLATKEGQKKIEDQYLKDAKLLVLDNQSCLFRTGKENESAGWDSAQEWFLSLRRQGISVLLIHHANKNGQQRGTSKKEDVMDTVIALRRPEDYDPSEGARFEVHYEKARHFYGEAAEPFEVQLKEQDNRFFWAVKELTEDSETQTIAMLDQEGISYRQIAKQMGLHESKVYRELQKIKKSQTGK